MTVLRRWRASVNPNSKFHYVRACPAGAAVLDIGCGNHSAEKFLSVNGAVRYTGVDIADYNISDQTKAAMHRYIVSPPDAFDRAIAALPERFDLVVCAHNIEHCHQPEQVIDAICAVAGRDATVYFSFPCEQSVRFPRRRGTLNFYDDPTHRQVPDFAAIERRLRSHGFDILVAERRARYWPEVLLGLAFEPVSAALRRACPGTWALWGFESVLVGRRRSG